MKNQYFFLGGLPRTGSTLLSAILSQNPAVHAEGNSALCQLMWDVHASCQSNARQQLLANRRHTTEHDILSELPDLYYKGLSGKLILDKCRSWTIKANFEILKKHITENPKVIVMLRPLEEVLTSYVHLFIRNSKYKTGLEQALLQEGSEPIMRSFRGVMQTMHSGAHDSFLYITYRELVQNTEATTQRIYDFFGWPRFNHDLEHIVNIHHENDQVYGLEGQHAVRTSIQHEPKALELPQDILNYCFQLNKQIGLHSPS